MPGFLGTRADFFSDLLVLALAVVVPALVVGVLLARKGKRRPHQIIMMALVAVLVLYVVIYETNMMLLGGIDYLDKVTTMARIPYFSMVAVHVAIGIAALVAGVWAIRRGNALLAGKRARKEHTAIAWWGVFLLGTSAITGLVIYWATFMV